MFKVTSPHFSRIPDEAVADNNLVFKLDCPSDSQPLSSNVNFVSGYCFHNCGPVEAIKLIVNGQYQSDAILNYPRVDAGARYPRLGDQALLSGFNAYFDHASLIPGANTFRFQIRAASQDASITKVFNSPPRRELRIADVFIDIVGPCNLKCAICPQGIIERLGAERGNGFISAELFERVVSRLLEEGYRGKSINLYNWGDPLLHPQLGQILDICAANRLHPVVSTNLSFRHHAYGG